ncbi:phosphatidate cytidylyltransferase [Thioploca ingrica]|uniref:Phosphatidate cytidylyltransferase n=1 Tax=Thioploca ingrica TaxID=40754 RepID=A0A090AGJ4_9GAMM|nr:phosphatidate cytidylyltransferase [Thioploca ingrica]
MIGLELDPAVRWTLGGIFGLLILASIVVSLLNRSAKPGLGELRQRINTWWVMVIVFGLAMTLSRTFSLLFFGFVSFLALKEYFSLIPTRRADRRVLFWAYLVIPLQYYWVYAEWYGMFIIFIPVYCFLLLPVRMLLVGETDGFLRAIGTLHWGLMTTVFSLSHAAFLLILRYETPSGMLLAGPGLMLYLVMLTQLNDVAQYLWGKLIGRDKIIPKVSPNKTWGGFLGGMLTILILAILLGPILTPMNTWQSALAGLIISIGGFFGDINISAIKRDLGIKDSGTLLPGHGGILDRVDSLTYTAPLFFHYIYYLFPWHTFGSHGILQ